MFAVFRQIAWFAVITEKDMLATFLRLSLFANLFPVGLLNAGFFKYPTYHIMFSWMRGYGMEVPMVYLVLIGGLVGPVLLFLGLFTRIGALMIIFSLALQMYYLGLTEKFFMNWGGAPPPNSEGLEYHFLCLFLMFGVLEKGGGSFSLDEMISKIAVENGAPLSLH